MGVAGNEEADKVAKAISTDTDEQTAELILANDIISNARFRIQLEWKEKWT